MLPLKRRLDLGLYIYKAMEINNKNNKESYIRKLLLKTVEKDPDLFCYYVAILEAKQLLGNEIPNKYSEPQIDKPNKKITDC